MRGFGRSVGIISVVDPYSGHSQAVSAIGVDRYGAQAGRGAARPRQGRRPAAGRRLPAPPHHSVPPHGAHRGGMRGEFGADDDDRTQAVSPDLPSPGVPTLDLPNYLGLLDRADYAAVPVEVEDIDFDPLVSSGRAGTRRVGIASWMEKLAAGNTFGRENDFMIDTDTTAAVMGCDDVDSWGGGLKK